MAISDHRRSFTFEKSPRKLAADAVAYQRTVSDMTQRDDTRRGVDQGLLKEWNEAKMAGIPEAKLPTIHGRMSPVDIENAQRQIRQLRGLPTQFPTQKPAAPTAPAATSAAPTLSPLTQAILTPQKTAAPVTASLASTTPSRNSLITQGGRPKPAAISAPLVAKPAAPAPADPLANLVRTPTGFQAPAMRPDGTQMSNPDGTARYVGTLPYRVPAGVESRVLDTGVGPTNARGETPMQTTRGKVVDVDPLKDLSKNWLAKGDPLLPQGADRGVVISPKYGGGVGYAYGSGAAPAPATPPTTPPVPASNFAAIGAPPKPATSDPLAGLPPAARAIPGQKPPGTMENPAPPSLRQMVTTPNSRLPINNPPVMSPEDVDIEERKKLSPFTGFSRYGM